MCYHSACRIVGAQEMAAFSLVLILKSVLQEKFERAKTFSGIEPAPEMLVSVKSNL